ncbi:MAG: type VI secretion system baseplate subunit TssG [Pseudomonadota bacterium]
MTGGINTEEPWRYNLFVLLRAMEREAAGAPRIGTAQRRGDDLVHLMQDPFLAFPASNVGRIEDKGDRLDIAVKFLGLLGPHGALPLSLTEEAHFWSLAEDDAFARFLDIFNNRFIQLFFRAWADARPITHHDRPQTDRFLSYVGAVVGLAVDDQMPPGAVPAIAKAGFAGLLSARVKSASRLRAFLAGLFDVEIEVEEFVPTALTLAEEDQSRLGAANSALGVDLMVGSQVLTFDEKIRIRITVSSLADYQSFLPSGPNAVRLADAVFFYLGDELDWDVELALPTALAPAATLGVAGQLGWTGWMTPQHPGQTATLLADARFKPPAPQAQQQQ